jgi:outer membrane protein assembly factor BamB/predicted phosphodiesterase
MKKIIILLFFLVSHQILSQTYRYAVLSDIMVGTEKTKQNLSKIIEDIHSKEISFVIVLGNITENGNDKELDSAKQILDGLDLPYYVIPGNNETKLRGISLTHFKELWDNNNFFYKKNNDIHIGLNCGIVWNGKGGHFSPDDLNWLNEILKDSVENNQDSSNIILYLTNQLNGEIDNWFKVTNILKNYKIKAVFTGESESNRLQNFNGMPGVIVQPSTIKSKYTNYSLIESNEDSLIISQIEIGKKRTEKIINVISKEKKYTIPEIDSVQLKDYSGSILWQRDLNANLPASFEVSASKTFTAEEDGNVLCFDLNGNKLWEYNTGETIIGAPAVEGDILSVATLEGDLFAVNANNGNVIQVIGLGEPLTSNLIIIDATGQDSKTKAVVTGTSKGEMFCYDIYTLENIWENNSAKGIITTLPLYIKDRIIYGSSDGFLYCIDARSGILNWKWRDKNAGYSLAGCEPVSNGKYVFISTSDKSICAVDLLLGTTIWRMKDYSSWESLGISNDNEKLFIKGLNNFYIVSSRTGKLIKEIKTDYGEDSSPVKPIEWNNKILFGTESGDIYSIDQKYNLEKLFFTGTALVNNIKHINKNIFAASNIDGKIILFTIK